MENKVYPKHDPKIDVSNLLKKACVLFLVMLFCTIVASLSYRHKLFESNIVMIYLLGIIIISYYSSGYLYSFIASISAILLYNFFFTAPYYTFKVDDPNHIITFLIMFLVGSIISMLTIRINLEKKQVQEREKYIRKLYELEKKLLNVKDKVELATVTSHELEQELAAVILVRFYNAKNEVENEVQTGVFHFQDPLELAASQEAYISGNECGNGTTLFSDAKAFYQPIFSQFGCLGVIGIVSSDHKGLSETQRMILDVVVPQVAVVLQREKNYEKQQITQVEIHKERLKSDMLRSISHDFRTPLAGVMGLSSTVIDNYEKLSDTVRKNFIQSIYEESSWLNEIVENILQTTRFDENRVNLKLQEEAAEEIITDAISHVRKHAINRIFTVEIPDEIILLQVDGILIRQVLINILNNAVSYACSDSKITVSLKRDQEYAQFEVTDDGPGIDPSELPSIFERYHKSHASPNSSKRGMGLGLSLCKSIIEAHNGQIFIENILPHGTKVTFRLVSEKEV